MGGIGGVEDVRERARGRIGGRSMALIDGDPIEALARAHERHAERLEAAGRELDRVGAVNNLGDTSEGRTASVNYRLSAVTGDVSFLGAIRAQAACSLQFAEALRATRRALGGTDADSAYSIRTVDT